MGVHQEEKFPGLIGQRQQQQQQQQQQYQGMGNQPQLQPTPPEVQIAEGTPYMTVERSAILLTALLSVCGVLVALLACHLWHHRKRKRYVEHDTELSGNGLGSHYNSFVNLNTPIVATKWIGAQLDRNATGFGSKLSGGSSAAESTSGVPCGSGGGACGTPGVGPSGCTTTPGVAQEKKPTPVHKRPLLETVKDPSIPGPRGYREPGLNHPETWPYSNLMSFLPNPLAEIVGEDNTPEQSDNAGHILFEMRYNFQETTLALKIVMAQDLPAKDLSGTSDPYVRVTLLPDKKSRLETKVKRRTLNPRWNETLYFEGFSIQKLQSRVLHLHVFDYDRFTRDDSIGEVFIPLCQIDFSQTHSFWKPLKIPPKDQCGELLVSLQYQSNKSDLTLTLHKARGLKAKDINGKSDPYVKIWLRFGEKRIEKCKTPVFKCTLNPVFDQTFTFNVPWEKIRECSLDIMVMDFDNIGRNELIGRIRLAGKNSSGATEAKQWQEMIAKPREVISQWHRLKAE